MSTTGNDVSNTRLYLGNLPRNATKADVENHFNTHGTGEITEIKLMNGFGFIEYKDAMDARDVVPAFHGSDFMGERLVVQFARGGQRPRDGQEFAPRMAPRPRRTVHRMTISGLPFETSWQDLKDFARQSGLDVVYSEVNRDRDPASAGKGYVEYETAEDLTSAVEKLDQSEFKGSTVHCIADVSSHSPKHIHSVLPILPKSLTDPNKTQSEIPVSRPRERFRSRSPGYRGGRGGYGPPPDDYYYDRRGPPRGYSPRRDDYRRRSPPPPRGGYYDDREDRYGGPPPRRGGPPMDDYPPPPPRGRYDDRYGGPPPPPRGGGGSGGGYDEPYANGHGREPYGGGRPPSPRRDGGRGNYERGGYDSRPAYW
ncbi:Hypothetical protein R9X50_00498500 [Acrodontium crateriforme]|uniref:RRM domain-containing protein n=1 Tax=Acrodontium crateriforme TaxID=150365 RepID=A0AAQ3RB70_9PEZI|nr:Hypothetical protein R9X50_00498500 [Acrodontium crateriforme]